MVQPGKVVGESCPVAPSFAGGDGPGGSGGSGVGSTATSCSMLAFGTMTYTDPPMSASSACLTSRSLLPGVTPEVAE
jgi:hypothetical protein